MEAPITQGKASQERALRSKHLRLRQNRPLNVMPEGRVLRLFWHSRISSTLKEQLAQSTLNKYLLTD